jgi:hypothetical protein
MKRIIALALIISMSLPVALFAQDGGVSRADSYNRGVMAAEDEHTTLGWGVGGFVSGGLFSWLGTGITVLIAHGSSPSPRYVPEDVEPMSYRSGYREEARRRNRRSAAIPGVVMSTLWTILVLNAATQ